MTGSDAIALARSPLSISSGSDSAEIRGYDSIRSPLAIAVASYFVAREYEGSRSVVKGSFLSVFHEWACHSVAAMTHPDDGSLSGLTIQATVFSDKGHGFPGFAMKASYLVLAFPLSVYDLCVSGGWAPDW